MRAPGKSKSVALNDGAFAPSTETTQVFPPGVRKAPWEPWTDGERAVLRAHPEMSAVELHALLPRRSPKAIRRMREREGRWSAAAAPTCRLCDRRPVWEESPRARRMGLCKGCYLDEMEHRGREDARANALRQSLFKERRRRS